MVRTKAACTLVHPRSYARRGTARNPLAISTVGTRPNSFCSLATRHIYFMLIHVHTSANGPRCAARMLQYNPVALCVRPALDVASRAVSGAGCQRVSLSSRVFPLHATMRHACGLPGAIGVALVIRASPRRISRSHQCPMQRDGRRPGRLARAASGATPFRLDVARRESVRKR